MRFRYILVIAFLMILFGCKFRTAQLHDAVRQNDIKTVQRLLDKGVPPDALNRYGATPLCYAAFDGNAEIAQILIKYGADVNKECHMVDGEHKRTWWPLYLAARKGSSINPKGHEAIAIMLIENGANVKLSDEVGFTLVHRAHFSEKLTRLLLEKGADINARNITGETPLHFAVRLGDEDAVRFLLDLGADVKAVNKKGETARDYAVRNNREEILKLIDPFQ